MAFTPVSQAAPTAPEPFVFTPNQLDDLEQCFRSVGFAILRGLWSEDTLEAASAQCTVAQTQVSQRLLDDRYGTTVLVDDESDATTALVNYVTYVTEVAPDARALVVDPVLTELMQRWLGHDNWLLEHERFGVVYQDARPGRESAYTRIGWHSDWQSAPHRNMWPSVAFTIHIDETSPANGFLRVVPGSHMWATPAPFHNINGAPVPEGSASWGGHSAEPPPIDMPLGFDKVPGEIAVYCERGDVLFHDAYLWHSAARATDDNTMRRHIRGGFYGGERSEYSVESDFVKNAAR